MIARESIYSAMAELLQGIPSLKKVSRRMVMWDQVDVSEMPVLFITQTAENASFQTKLPTKWTLRTELYLYGANNGERDESAMTTLNPIIDAIEAALAPKGGVEEQTLGGLVHRCRIDGAVQIVEGVFDQKTVVVIPVVIFVS